MALTKFVYISGLYIRKIAFTQNGRHFADDTFKCIFLNENVWIPITIWLEFVSKGPMKNILALVQIMACAVQATSHYLNQWWLVYRRIYASLGLNELKLGTRAHKTIPVVAVKIYFVAHELSALRIAALVLRYNAIEE